ncbi:leucine-rich repeat-containing protein c10orf11 homolog [Plakobranchus ocellatus]|uniref:Leucine-rich repeat-containing protein c10orf11 homolog n=1 Tax=Plakobranchus ocellatus TaxID=259542 RepID=A0AAV4BFK8_9GAST|nr:leucine-rich repeat-containing protein c10orf11 homolog [Plakobranchus ocellatus]
MGAQENLKSLNLELSLNNVRVSLAYSELTDFPPDVIAKFGQSIVELDMSHNRIADLRFLVELPNIQSLVLDHNHVTSQVKMPLCRHLHTLWVNHNRIQNLGFFLQTIAKNCPNLRILSMMNNEAAPSYFNGGTYQQYVDYRYFVISSLPNLEVLDYTPVTDTEKREAKRIYPSGLFYSLAEAQVRRKLMKKKKDKGSRESGNTQVTSPE